MSETYQYAEHHIVDKSKEKILLSVIEKIKAELTSKAPRHTDGTIARYSYGFSLDDVLDIIDQCVKECTHEIN